ncbi:hypothetical protein GGQ85_003995 [Nitrobacter vulgaris]|nr:hypothetical protein [Nitrobacter vulgaris]
MSVLFGHAGFGKGADDAAGCCPGRCADCRRRQPASRNNWPQPWDRKQAEARQESRGSPNAGTNAGTGACAFYAIINAIAVPINILIGIKPAVRVIRHKADVRLGYSGGLKPLNGRLRLRV